MMNQEEALYLARTNFRTYISLICPHFIFSPFHEYLINKIQDVLDGKITRLCVSTCPRVGKSFLLSELLPSFAFVRNPLEQVIAVSYGASLANEFGYKVRQNLNSPLHKNIFPWSTIPGDGKSGTSFKLSPITELESKYPDLNWNIPLLYRGFGSGSYFSCGVGGSLTGRPITLGIVDDSIKNRQQADSPTYTSRLHQFFGPDLFSRLEPGARCIVINTRWNNQDLIGYILSNFNNWEYLRIPAICDSEDDPLGRPIGAPLFPEKYDLDALEEIRATNTERDFAALYQQDPQRGATNLWKPSYTRIVDPDDIKSHEIIKYFIAYDCASELHDLADYTAITIWGYCKGRKMLLIDSIEEKMDFSMLVEKMISLNGEYNSPTHIVEKASNGTALHQYMGTNHPEIHIACIPTSKSKITRLSLCTKLFGSGNVLLSKDANNLDTLLGQFQDLMGSLNDDLADSSMLALLYMENYEIPNHNEDDPPIQILTPKKKRFQYGSI